MAMLEGRCAAEAVRNARTTDIALLQDIHARLEAAARDGRIDAFFEANQEFHKKIQELSGNRWLLSVIRTCARYSSSPACIRCPSKAACSSRWTSTG
jgi:DNA-binding GntR family transcriptional regulator